MKTDFNKIYSARNRTKRQWKVYGHEAVGNAAEFEARKLLGKSSRSEFAYFSMCVVLGKLGHRFDFLSQSDRRKITALHRAITCSV